MRRFSTARPAFRRAVTNPRPLVLRPPQEPLAKSVEVPEDHPLWQFFSDKTFIRHPEDIRDKGDAWSVPQLRRKSFEDLHALWYVSLKEWNRLARESQIIKQWSSDPGQDTIGENSSVFDDGIKKVRTTMWRIRHVLAERYHSYRQAEIDIKDEYPRLVSEFSNEYLTADSNADSEVTGQLERFQYAFYGINPLLEGNFPDPKVLQGLYVVARLKLLRYAGEQNTINTVNNVREAFLLFTSEHTPEGIQSSIELIQELRDNNNEPIEDEIEELGKLMFNAKTEVSV